MACQSRNMELTPQKPYLLQQTFKGHLSAVEYPGPHPGLHSAFSSQVDVQLPSPQNCGPRPVQQVNIELETLGAREIYLPQLPFPASSKGPQQPDAHFFDALQV